MADVIFGISGPVVTVRNSSTFSMLEMVLVGRQKLAGEVIGMTCNLTTIQVYEDTSGLCPGEPVVGTGEAMSISLSPGLLESIFDGIGRPLLALKEKYGSFIEKGSSVPSADEGRRWDVKISVCVGDELFPGKIFAVCPETQIIEHRAMVPPGVSGKVTKTVPDGHYKATDTLITLQDEKGHTHELSLSQKWPIRTPRPVKDRFPLSTPLVTGQRVIDTLFPIAKGGAAAVPGGFGAGKTMTQHQLAKWCDADIIVYVGCGERGNEMCQALAEFSALIDPKSGRPMTERTVLIANTSNMPVAAREASIYTGITIAEYYRDMGYHVAVMADSTSRWAEALREISGRLEEMPAEEGFPAYLPSRLSEFYERAGMVKTLDEQQGSVTIIGAVSPQGADFSEPVTQNTKRFVRSFWALDKNLAYKRHYPAINWMTSYSEYFMALDPWFKENVSEDFLRYRDRIGEILHEESKLLEIVSLVGEDVLPDDQKLVMEIARVIREGYLQQNAFHKDDTFVPLKKQCRMMRTILHLENKAKQIIASNIPISKIVETGIFSKLIKMKYDVPNNNLEKFDDYILEIDETFEKLFGA